MHSRHSGVDIETMKRSVFAVGLAGLFAALTLSLTAQAQTNSTNFPPGLAVGQKAPAFTLLGQDDREHTLAEYLKKGKVALVFFRSADW